MKKFKKILCAIFCLLLLAPMVDARTVYVRAHRRRCRSGKVVWVRRHTRNIK